MFCDLHSFRPKSSWLQPEGHASLEIIFTRLER